MLRTGTQGPRRGDLAAATRFKGTAAVLLAAHFAGHDAALIAGLGAFLGHLFPVWLKFKGGKGVATYIGLLIGLYWPARADLLRIWLVVASLSRYSSLAALVASALTPLALWLFGQPDAALLFLAAERAVVDHAPRQYRPPAQGQRRQDRGETRSLTPVASCNFGCTRAVPLSDAAPRDRRGGGVERAA